MSRPGSASPGFWLLGSLLCLSFAASIPVNDNRASADLSSLLVFSKQLMEAASEALDMLKKIFNCTLESLCIPTPNNEAMLTAACVKNQSKTSCMDAIHNILQSYGEYLKYSKSFGSPNLLNAANNMMQALKINSKNIEEASDISSGCFKRRMHYCKFLLTFKQLAETIDRVLNYQNYPEPELNC